MYIILVYDISNTDNGSFIQRNIYKTCKKYLYHVQNSVFEGELSESQYKRLLLDLKTYIRECDSVIVFKSRNGNWLEKEFLANDNDITSDFV